MNVLGYTVTIVGTLVFACLFDHFVTKVFSGKPPKDSIEHLLKLVEDLEPDEFKKRKRRKRKK